MMLTALVLGGCGGHATSVPASGGLPAPATSLLTLDEASHLFLENAQIWKYESNPGAPNTEIKLVLVENGHDMDSMSSSLPHNRMVSKIIVVVTNESDRHVIRLLTELDDPETHSHLSTIDRGTMWFSKPLTESVWSTQELVSAIPLGTTILLAGSMGTAGSSHSWTQQTAQCRLELRIK